MAFPENEGITEEPTPSATPGPSIFTPSPMTLPPPAFTPEKVLHVLRDVVLLASLVTTSQVHVFGKLGFRDITV